MNAENKKRTITLTGRAPVTIVESDWPVIAKADADDAREPALAFEANRKWQLRVRRHEDGRTIVYGTHNTRWQGERDTRAGTMLTAALFDSDTAAAITSVAERLDAPDGLAGICIADLPAEEI